MKRAFVTIIFAAVLLTSGAANAQEKTLFGGDRIKIGWFGGPTVTYTHFNGQSALLMGGQGAVLINNLVYLGGAGYGTATRVNAPGSYIDNVWSNMRYDLGYGGGLAGVIIKNDRLIHAMTDVLIGGGTITWTGREVWDGDNHDNWYQNHHDAFFFVQPMVHAELNVTNWMRADLGAGYRFVSGVTLNDLSNNDVGGPVAGLTFRFGKF